MHSTFIAEVLNSEIDNATAPCDNFYQYTCGKWAERNMIPDILTQWNVYRMTELYTKVIMRGNGEA